MKFFSTIYDKMDDYFLEECEVTQIPRLSYLNKIEFLHTVKKKMDTEWSFYDALKIGIRKKNNSSFYNYLTEKGQRELQVIYYTFKIRCVKGEECSLDIKNDYRKLLDKIIEILEKKRMK